MKKIWTFIPLTLAMCANTSFCQPFMGKEGSPWNGFYIGANAGYLWTANSTMTNDAEASLANPLVANSGDLAATLVGQATRVFKDSLVGFVGGGQFGWDVLFTDNLLLGLSLDFDGLAPSTKEVRATFITPTDQFGTYTTNVHITKKLEYLGLLNGRFGALLNPSLLVYVSGAYAYGGASLLTNYSFTNSIATFSPIDEQQPNHQILSGWSAGGGAEWMLMPCLSVKLEYVYYNLGPIRNNFTVTQNISGISVAAAVIESLSIFSNNVVRVGVNYRFA